MIADVSGKGIPAALFMALSVTVLRFGMTLNLAPEEVTRRANEMIISEQRSRMFATTFVAYIAIDSGEMVFASGDIIQHCCIVLKLNSVNMSPPQGSLSAFLNRPNLSRRTGS